jgi:Flp pilus assembly protein TadG
MSRILTTLRRLKREEGSNLLEYGLVAILFMTLMFGLMGLGQMLYGYHFVAHAAKSGARWASVNGATCGTPAQALALGVVSCPSCDSSCNGSKSPLMNTGPASASDVGTYVTTTAPQGIDANAVTVNATWPVETNSPTICSASVPGVSTAAIPNFPGCTVDVQVSYNFRWFYPLGNATSVTLSSDSATVITH